MQIPVEGFMYPNEVELQWSVLIVLYPFITGLVAGAFILASLERVFRVDAVKPTYRLALLTALAFLLVAPLPLQLHLGHPERSLEMYLTPHRSSAMAMFGFVYLWYLMGVLLLEIWLDYRRDIVAQGAEFDGSAASALSRFSLWVPIILAKLPAHRREARVFHYADRDSVCVPAARLCRFHIRIGEGEPVVVFASHAGRVSVLGDGVGHRCGDAAVYVFHPHARTHHRHALSGYDRAVPALYLHYRLQPGDARPDPANLRGRRILPQSGFHGAHAAVDLTGDRANPPWDVTPIALLGLIQILKFSEREKADLRSRGVADADRNSCHALECRDRRTTLLEEFSGIHHVQDGLCDPRGPVTSGRTDGPSIRDSVGFG